MIKSEFIDKLTLKLNRLSRGKVDVAVSAILDIMCQSLMKGEGIEIRGFGSFSLRVMKSRTARNPKTGATFQLKEKARIHFKPGKLMKDNVNNTMI